METCKFVSETIGNYTVRTTSESYSNSGESQSESSYSRALIMPDEVRRLDKGEVLYVTSNLNPFKLDNTPAYENDDIQAKLGKFKDKTAKIKKGDVKITSKMKV